MSKVSAGLLLYRIRDERLEVLLVHPGGAFWAKNDLGSWTIRKGERLCPTRIQLQLPFANSKRSWIRAAGQIFAALAWSANIHAWAFEATATPRRSRVIPSRSNGRRTQDSCRSIPQVDPVAHLVASVPALAQRLLETAACASALRRVQNCTTNRFNSL